MPPLMDSIAWVRCAPGNVYIPDRVQASLTSLWIGCVVNSPDTGGEDGRSGIGEGNNSELILGFIAVTINRQQLHPPIMICAMGKSYFWTSSWGDSIWPCKQGGALWSFSRCFDQQITLNTSQGAYLYIIIPSPAGLFTIPLWYHRLATLRVCSDLQADLAATPGRIHWHDMITFVERLIV